MQYIVLERKVYERYYVVDADDPEEAKEISRNKSYENDEPVTYVGTEYIASEILRARKEN